MKSILQSKTFWVAVLQAAVGVVVVFATVYPAVGGILVAKSVLDIVLRVFTETKISV